MGRYFTIDAPGSLPTRTIAVFGSYRIRKCCNRVDPLLEKRDEKGRPRTTNLKEADDQNQSPAANPAKRVVKINSLGNSCCVVDTIFEASKREEDQSLRLWRRHLSIGRPVDKHTRGLYGISKLFWCRRSKDQAGGAWQAIG